MNILPIISLTCFHLKAHQLEHQKVIIIIALTSVIATLTRASHCVVNSLSQNLGCLLIGFILCLQLRNAMDPKRHYKKSESKLSKYFQASVYCHIGCIGS